MADHARIPTPEEWDAMLDEIGDTVELLRAHGPVLRRLAKSRARDGYPTSSMSDSSIGSGGTSDPVGSTVVANISGETKGPISTQARRMEREVLDSRNRLRTALDAIRQAMPTELPEEVREVCAKCGDSRRVVKRWVKERGMCGTCARREDRRRPTMATGTAGR